MLPQENVLNNDVLRCNLVDLVDLDYQVLWTSFKYRILEKLDPSGQGRTTLLGRVSCYQFKQLSV